MYTFFSGFTATPTKIRTFLECPRKYWYTYINPETKGISLERSYFTLGHHVHDALRDFFGIPSSSRTGEILLQLLEQQWKTKNGPAGGFSTPEIELEAKNRAISMLKLFLKTENWRITPVYLPEKTGGKIPGYKFVPIDKELAIGGIIDRMDMDEDGILNVIDYKTGKGDEPDEWQLPMYAVLMGRLQNRFIGRISYLFLHHGKRHTEEVSIAKNVEIINKVRELVSKIPKSKTKDEFVCPDGARCNHCNYLLEVGFDPLTGEKSKS